MQLTGALRNLSDSPSICEMFISADIILQLASLLLDHMTNADIIFNISRLFRLVSVGKPYNHITVSLIFVIAVS